MTGPSRHLPGTNGFEHLSEADLAGFLDNDVSPDERLRLEAHVDECAECRRELVALSRIVHAEPTSTQLASRRRRRSWISASAVAAAGIALVVLPRLTPTSSVPGAPPTRRLPEEDGRPRLDIVSPVDGPIAAGRLVFTWHRGTADVYSIVLTTESGDPVWTADTNDTTIALPDSVSLQRGHAYFWHVDGIGNGIAASTGAHRLDIPRDR